MNSRYRGKCENQEPFIKYTPNYLTQIQFGMKEINTFEEKKRYKKKP